ncbi:invasion associated locus B family protein [Amorphus sp. 3PC139-8]
MKRQMPFFSFRRFAKTAAVTTLAALMVPAAALAQGQVKSSHGDWQIRCDTPAGAQGEQCALIQNVTAEDRENVGLTVIVLRTADSESRILRVLAPLGVLLPSGLGLTIDDEDVGRAGFVRCLPNGCVAEVVLDDELLSKFEAGQTATFIIFQTPEEGIGIPISLTGFSDGFNALP